MLTVVAAVIKNASGEWLIAQRPEHKIRGGQWEFPGGKVDAGESRENALIRELQEELGVTISALRPLCSKLHHYPDVTVSLHAYLCIIGAGKPTPIEHQRIAWVTTSALGDYQLSGADRAIVDILCDAKNRASGESH